MFKTLYATLAVLLLTACAQPADKMQMAVDPQIVSVPSNPKFIGAMEVRSISGGTETNPLWISEVGDTGFRSALKESLYRMNYEAKDKAPKYFVDAKLQSIDQPLMGFSFEVKSTVLYTVETQNKRKEFAVTATGVSGATEHFVGYVRLKRATERSIHNNIQSFLTQLSKGID